jgi:hypothetical protein
VFLVCLSVFDNSLTLKDNRADVTYRKISRNTAKYSNASCEILRDLRDETDPREFSISKHCLARRAPHLNISREPDTSRARYCNKTQLLHAICAHFCIKNYYFSSNSQVAI